MKRVSRTSTLLSELMVSASACKHVISGLRDVAVSVSVTETIVIQLPKPLCCQYVLTRLFAASNMAHTLTNSMSQITSFVEIIIFLSEIQTIG